MIRIWNIPTNLWLRALGVALTLLPLIVNAQATASFSDVPENHSVFTAVEYLREKGVLQGYADGTFKPENKVNRAEGVKIIVSSVVSQNQIDALGTTTVFSDVPSDAWYVKYVEYARQNLGIIDCPPKKTAFYGTQPVKKAEFLKMLLLGRKIDPNGSFSELKGPWSSDVGSDEWHSSYMKYGISSSMVMANEDGLLEPAKELTRGDVALLLFRLDMYQQNRRTQALLSEAEAEIVNVLKFLEAKDANRAFTASNRALLAARGALLSKPDESIVKAAVKTAEGFQVLVRAYVAGIEGRLNDVLQLTSDAWHLAEKAKEFSGDLSDVASQMQAIAKTMADEARGLMKQ